MGLHKTIVEEAIYMEYLRGEPGIPTLYGAFFDSRGDGDGGGRVGGRTLHIVVEMMGNRVGEGSGSALKPTRLSEGYKAMAVRDPIGVAAAWVRCFRSFALHGGYLLHDFTPRQFTYRVITTSKGKRKPAIYLVDGPMLIDGPLAAVMEVRCVAGGALGR